MRKKREHCSPGLVEMNWNNPLFSMVVLEAVLMPAETIGRDHVFFRHAFVSGWPRDWETKG